MQSYEYAMNKRVMLNRNNHGTTFITVKRERGRCESRAIRKEATCTKFLVFVYNSAMMSNVNCGQTSEIEARKSAAN